jgi:hypothetical protein
LFFLIIKHRWRNEAAEFPLDQFGQLQRRQNPFHAEARLAVGQRAELADYKNSGGPLA